MSTPVRLLSGVRPHVTLEQPGPRESLVTDLTLVVVGVCQHVHVEGRGGHIVLVANVARLEVLLGLGQVGLPVTREVGAGGKVFAALPAPVPGRPVVGVDLGSPVIVKHRVHCEGLDGDNGRGEGGGGGHGDVRLRRRQRR